ncbi:hypothetical protein PV516_19650 [Streptomyces scabiei]|uniref:hypothetical protein n=1 Tax=Streptomyces scabiei TaxID=1930 RepID=UPI0029AFC8ED|nr:hypothetical protein [Streptomyces scabiei]MDX3166006.1 hypothetical protein [Streptomyces scabiei]
MTATPDRLDLPARRRRHARLIATLTSLIRACAEAAGAVYQPIAAAPPGQETVEVDLLPCLQVSLSAATLLDLARAEDDARWPTAVAREREETRRTYAARCSVAEAQELTEQAGPPGEHGVPLPTVHQSAAMNLTSAGDEVAARWRHDPQQAAALVRDLVASGELTVDEVLDEAVDAAVLPGLLALEGARGASDPSTAAELCLSAVPHIALAATLASADLDVSPS